MVLGGPFGHRDDVDWGIGQLMQVLFLPLLLMIVGTGLAAP